MKDLVLRSEVRSFQNDKNESVEYRRYYVVVDVNGTNLEVDLKPTSALGKQLLSTYLPNIPTK